MACQTRSDKYTHEWTAQEQRECILSEWLDAYEEYPTMDEWLEDCEHMERAYRNDKK